MGINYFNTVITPNVAESVKTIMAHYTAENLIGNRDKLAEEIEELLGDQLSKYNIEVVSTAIEDMDFTDEFTNAVEAKQVAQQNKLTTQTEQEAQIIIANTEAEKKVIAAQAEAETAKIAADAEAYKVKVEAEAKAKANEEVANSLTEMLIEYTKILNWDGSVPNVQFSSADGNVYPVIDIPVPTGD